MSKSVSEIKIQVELNEDKHPESIKWIADGPEGIQSQDCKAMLVSFFDEASLETFKIDLWTNKMQIAEMDRFMFHTLNALADTYNRSTQNNELANQMKSFAKHFGEFTEIIPK